MNCSKKNKQLQNTGEDIESYVKARKFRDSGKTDSAFYYYNIAKIKYQEMKDSMGAAQSLINMAIIQTNQADYFGGIETSVLAENYLKKLKGEKAKDYLGRNYNNIAIASSRLKNFDDALVYYKKALDFAPKELHPILYNNIGDAYNCLGNYQKAINVLNQGEKGSDSLNLARVITNRAMAKFQINSEKSPLKDFREALKIRQKLNDQTSLNSSYAALSDYYKKINRKDSALFYAEKMLQTSKNINNADDELEALQRLIYLNHQNSATFSKIFIEKNDSLSTARLRAKNQFALIKSNIDKTEAENTELALKNIENEQKTLFTNITVAVLCLLLIFGWLYFNKRKKLQQKEKELEVRKTELKYSKKVHDVVANGIYQVMTKLENQQQISLNETLDDLEEVYNKSRNISYEGNSDNSEEEFSDKIRKLASYFKNENTETYLAGNDSEIWKNLNPNLRSETYQILRELLVNMKKHSKANRVILKFSRQNNELQINYIDNGVGIKEKQFYKNGLQNVVSRIENLNGEITFDTETETGLKINFSFPVS